MNGRNITKIVRNMNLYKNKKRLTELNENEFELIRKLSKHNGMSQAEMTAHLNVDKALVSRMVGKLSALGYIRVERDTKDTRKRLLFAEEKAYSLKLEEKDFEEAYYERILGVLSKEEQEELALLIEKVYLESKRLRKEGFADE